MDIISSFHHMCFLPTSRHISIATNTTEQNRTEQSSHSHSINTKTKNTHRHRHQNRSYSWSHMLHSPVANNILEHCSDNFFSLFNVSAFPSKGTYTGSKLFRTSTPRSATFIFSSGRTMIFLRSALPSKSDPALGRSLTWPVGRSEEMRWGGEKRREVRKRWGEEKRKEVRRRGEKWLCTEKNLLLSRLLYDGTRSYDS